MSQTDDPGGGAAAENVGAPSGLPGQDRSMLTDATPVDDDRGEALDESLGGADVPPGHPSSGDPAVSAGEILSGHDGTGGTGSTLT